MDRSDPLAEAYSIGPVTFKSGRYNMVYVTHERRVIRNVPLELWRRVRILAVNREWTVSKLVIEATWDYLERADQEGRE